MDMTVSPDSKSSEIDGINQWRDRVEVSIAKRAESGKANKALVTFLSNILKKENIQIVKGKRSKHKRVFVPNSSKDEIVNALRDL